MIKYFKSLKNSDLIALDTDTNEITEYVEIRICQKEETLQKKAEVKTEIKKEEKIVTKKAKGDRICDDCGKTVEPGKYLCKGRCAKCYSLFYYGGKRSEKSKVKKEVHHDHKKKYECVDCGEEVFSDLEFDQVKCPRNENHIMVQK